MNATRVVVTGLGVVAPNGVGVAEYTESLLAGRSGIGPITLFDAAGLPTRIAGQVAAQLPAPLPDRKIAFALEAARQAFAQASACGSRPRGAGSVSLGVGLELFSMEDLVERQLRGRGLPAAPAERLSCMQTPADLCAHFLAHAHALAAPPSLHVSACAAGTDAVGHAFRLVRSGRRAYVLAGGTDSMINPLGVAGFATLNAMSTRNASPEQASRPFDRQRDGFVLGEGAGVLLLERRADALARGAELLGELVGYGSSLDAHGISEPHPEGRGAAQAMQRALDDARLAPEQISALNAHGTATPKNDPAETLAIRRVFGEHARRLPISATKSMIGHLISGAGAVEAVAALACMNRSAVHPTINLDEADPACDLDYVPQQARAHQQRFVLSASYGFGGHNAALILASAAEAYAER